MIEILKYLISHPWLLTYVITTGLLSYLDYEIYKEYVVKLKKKGYLIVDKKIDLKGIKDNILGLILMLLPIVNVIATIVLSGITNDENLFNDYIKDRKKEGTIIEDPEYKENNNIKIDLGATKSLDDPIVIIRSGERIEIKLDPIKPIEQVNTSNSDESCLKKVRTMSSGSNRR